MATRAACLASLSKRHVHRFSNSATSKMMKAECMLEVASNDAWYPNVCATCTARSLLPFPVHPASPIFVHADRVTPSLRAMYVEGGCPNGVRILPLTHFCSPPYWRIHPDHDTDAIPTTPTDGWTIFPWHTGTAMLMFSGYTSHQYGTPYTRGCGF